VPLRARIANESEPAFAEPVSAPPVKLEEVRPPFHKREQTEDPATGEVTIEIVDDFGMYREASHGLISGRVGRETARHPARRSPVSAHVDSLDGGNDPR
jgi:hypothetical protein